MGGTPPATAGDGLAGPQPPGKPEAIVMNGPGGGSPLQSEGLLSSAGAEAVADRAGPDAIADAAETMAGASQAVAEIAAGAIELLGIAIIVGFGVYAIALAIIRAVKRDDAEHTFQNVRHRLGRGILLGLEFLVAADIIHTVAVELTWETVGVLAVIVVIRTFLSFTLELEITGKWPWQQHHPHPDPHHTAPDSRTTTNPKTPTRDAPSSDAASP